MATTSSFTPGPTHAGYFSRYPRKIRSLSRLHLNSPAEDRRFAPDALWELVVRRGGHVSYPQRHFIESWARRIAELDPDRVAGDDRLRTLIAERELRLKGARARLANRSRLVDWTPGVGVGRMDFRWVRVRQFLTELHRGFAA